MKAAGLLEASTDALGVLAFTGSRTVNVEPLPTPLQSLSVIRWPSLAADDSHMLLDVWRHLHWLCTVS